MQHPREGLIAVHSAVLLFGVTALFSKLIQLPALEITLLRSIFAAIALVAFIRVLGQPLRLDRGRDYGVALLLGVLLATHWVTYFHAMQVSSVAVGVIALHTFPVITVFLEPMFHGERPHLRDVVSALVVLVGIYLLVPEFALSDSTTQGVLWGVFSALLYSLRNIIQRRHFAQYPAPRALFYQTVVVVAVLLPFGAQTVPAVTQTQWTQLLLLAVVFTALPHALFGHALRHLKAKTASLVACLQVVYATLMAALVLGEWPTVTTVVGGLLVVVTAMFESYTAGRSSPPRKAPAR